MYKVTSLRCETCRQKLTQYEVKTFSYECSNCVSEQKESLDHEYEEYVAQKEQEEMAEHIAELLIKIGNLTRGIDECLIIGDKKNFLRLTEELNRIKTYI